MAEQEIERPEVTVGAFILNSKDEFLFVRSPKWTLYTIPGGHVEMWESFEEAVKRETKEEVGIDIDVIKLLSVQNAVNPEGFHKEKHFLFVDFLCRAKSEELKPDGREVVETVWVPPREALKLNIDKYTRNVVEEYIKSELTPSVE